MSDPKELADFIKWSKANYPAKHYMLIVSSHGNGWLGCCRDEKHNGWASTPAFASGLKQGREESDGQPLDVVGFDACSMGNIETDDQLQGEAHFLVGSEEVTPGAGWQYDKLLSPLSTGGQSTPAVSPLELVKNVVSLGEGSIPTLAAVDTSKIPALVDSTHELSQALLDTRLANSAVAKVADKSQRYFRESDLYDFADRLSTKFALDDPKLAQAAEAVKKNVANAVIAEEHTDNDRYARSHGLTIDLDWQGTLTPDPSADSATSSINYGNYANTRFAHDTHFDQARARFHLRDGETLST